MHLDSGLVSRHPEQSIQLGERNAATIGGLPAAEQAPLKRTPNKILTKDVRRATVSRLLAAFCARVRFPDEPTEYFVGMIDQNAIVYSTDPELNRRCQKCKAHPDSCSCKRGETVDLRNVVAVLRLEKSGRNGKPVTVIDRLPPDADMLEQTARELKKKCAVGGTTRLDKGFGLIEIQGDKRDTIRLELARMGIRSKG